MRTPSSHPSLLRACHWLRLSHAWSRAVPFPPEARVSSCVCRLLMGPRKTALSPSWDSPMTVLPEKQRQWDASFPTQR